MKNASKVVLKRLKHKTSSPCLHNANKEDAEQKPFSMTCGFAKGFTLIELLVVVLIIGILSAVALPQYRIAVAKSRVAEQMVLFSSLMKAQQVYYMANGVYTTDLSALDIQMPNNSVICNMNEGQGNFVWCQAWHASNAVLAGVSLEYSLNKQVATNNCIAKTELGDKVCKSFGGEYKSTHSNGNRYYSFDL